MKQLAAGSFLSLALLGLPCAAQPQLAYTTKNVHLRAGPSRDYPVLAILAQDAQVSVQGCLSDYSWCDVIVGPFRGWVYAGNLDYGYQGTQVPILTFGAQIGIGIIGFFLPDYWGEHYRDRPFYRDRDRWEHRHPPRSAPPGGPHYEPPRPPAPHPVPPRSRGPRDHDQQPPRSGSPGERNPQPPFGGGPRDHNPHPPGDRNQQPPRSGGPPDHNQPGAGSPPVRGPQPGSPRGGHAQPPRSGSPPQRSREAPPGGRDQPPTQQVPQR